MLTLNIKIGKIIIDQTRGHAPLKLKIACTISTDVQSTSTIVHRNYNLNIVHAMYQTKETYYM